MKKINIKELERGQGIFEYTIISIVILVVIIIVAPVMLGVISNWWANFWIDQEKTIVEVDGFGLITIGEVNLINENIVNIISVDTIELPNCNGSSELTISRELQKSVRRSIQYVNTIDVDFDMNILLTDISAHIYNSLELESQTEINETTTIEVKAAAGTSMTYFIDWMEIKRSGTVEVTQGEETYLVEFMIPSALDANLREPVRSGC